MPLLVGTSGWQYADWRRVLYPERVPKRRWLETYAESFATIEINNAFYRLPSYETFAGWRARLPEDFVVGVKASRFLSHVKRLREPEEPVGRLMGAAAGLGDRLGPVLLQLPPNMRAEPARLAACLDAFPPGVRVAVEPRHTSWWTEEVRSVLAQRGAALCWADRRGRPWTPLWGTAPWGYLRLHEGASRDWPRYGTRALSTWIRRIAAAWPEHADVYVFFNNDQRGAAVRDAVHFGALARAAGHRVTRTDVAAGGARSA